MKELDARAFANLFRDAYQKCFSSTLTTPLTESESMHLSVEIAERTGHEVGWKSLKNYSHYLLGRPQGKSENPSTATLDTLARYVVGAPTTEQPQRRHHPYWFRYKEEFQKSQQLDSGQDPQGTRSKVTGRRVTVVLAGALIALLLVVVWSGHIGRTLNFTDEFDTVTEDALAERGWSLQSQDVTHWAKRNARPGHLTLFTLRGDNWPHTGTAPSIKNLLVRDIPWDCFVADLRLTAFFPTQNWQQAGLLLLEDTSVAGKSLRLSLGFNDFAGGFPKTKEIIIQAVTSLGPDVGNPEEIAHQRLFVVEPGTETVIGDNLAQALLRIGKRGPRFRLLYSAGSMSNAAFKEVASTELDLRARYVGIFALKGFVSNADDVPVYVDAFSLTSSPCDH